jgi:hypothetical protein
MTLAKPRAWRLTHAQVQKHPARQPGLHAALGRRSSPAEGRIDASNSRNGFANRADGLAISPLLADAYFTASEELADDVVAKPTNYGITCPSPTSPPAPACAASSPPSVRRCGAAR